MPTGQAVNPAAVNSPAEGFEGSGRKNLSKRLAVEIQRRAAADPSTEPDPPRRSRMVRSESDPVLRLELGDPVDLGPVPGREVVVPPVGLFTLFLEMGPTSSKYRSKPPGATISRIRAGSGPRFQSAWGTPLGFTIAAPAVSSSSSSPSRAPRRPSST